MTAIRDGPMNKPRKPKAMNPPKTPRIVSDRGILMPTPISKGLMKLSTVLTNTPTMIMKTPQTEIDHAAAAQEYQLELKSQTVVVYGNPKLGTPTLAISPTLGIDVPFRALVWQNDQGQVYLTYNSAAYIANYVYPRHGLTIAGDAPSNLEQFLNEIIEQATK